MTPLRVLVSSVQAGLFRAQPFWRMPAFGILLWFGALLLFASPLAAQGQVDIETRLSAHEVEVGEVFQLTLTATSTGDARAENPMFNAPAGIASEGPQLSTRRDVSISGAGIVQTHGLTANWYLRASKPGRYSLGAPTIEVDGRRVSGQSTSVEVVPADPNRPRQRQGQDRRKRGSVIDPFDLFGPNSGFPFDFDDPDRDLGDDPRLGAPAPYPDEYHFERAPDATAFLRATVDRNRVVVGQQVLLSIYAYGAHGSFGEASPSEPGLSGFLSYSIVESSYGQRTYRVPAVGRSGRETRWTAVKVRELALFPISAGRLSIEPMTFGFQGRRYSRDRYQGLRRKSNRLRLEVVEPPLAGRPAGYRIGDVGRYELSAQFEPRRINAGDSVSVRVHLEGEGHLPYRVRTPEQRGVEWLEPNITGEVGPKDGVVSGFRNLSYIVRVDRPGTVDLGAVTLPYYDPEKSSYVVARAELGQVEVAARPGGADAGTTSDDRQDNAAPALEPRAELGSAPTTPFRPAEHPWFWWLLGAGPASVLFVDGAVRLGRTLRRRFRERQHTHRSQARAALRAAREAAARPDSAATASALERALFTAIEGATGLKARAILKTELGEHLRRAGIAAETAESAEQVLAACDTLRFAAGPDNARGLVARAERAVDALDRNESRPLTEAGG